MHKSLRYQKAQQEMVDIQHFNQQEREDCQNCKTRLSYCRISAVVSGKAIPTNGLVNRSLLDVPFSTLIITFPSHTVLRRLPLPLEIGSSQDMLSMIRELRQTLKLKVCASHLLIFQRMGCFDGQFVGENSGVFVKFEPQHFWRLICVLKLKCFGRDPFFE